MNEIFDNFYNYESEKKYIITKPHDPEAITNILSKYDFSRDRINSGIEKLDAIQEQKKQTGLTEYF